MAAEELAEDGRGGRARREAVELKAAAVLALPAMAGPLWLWLWLLLLPLAARTLLPRCCTATAARLLVAVPAAPLAAAAVMVGGAVVEPLKAVERAAMLALGRAAAATRERAAADGAAGEGESADIATP